jgi:PTH1 family peptidyl-tRNA hydrolase
VFELFAMKLIVGLGNPGSQYEKTRHNAGFMVVDRLAKAHAPSAIRKANFHSECVDATIGQEKCLLMKPTTFMNRSGSAVSEAVRFYKLNPATDLLVVVDDIYLDVGVIRLKPGGGAGGHNGLTDVQAKLGTESYPRLRIGVGAKPPVMDQADWVLSRFREDEWAVIGAAAETAAGAAAEFASKGLDAAMNKFNAADKPKEKKPRPEGSSPAASGSPKVNQSVSSPRQGEAEGKAP